MKTPRENASVLLYSRAVAVILQLFFRGEDTNMFQGPQDLRTSTPLHTQIFIFLAKLKEI